MGADSDTGLCVPCRIEDAGLDNAARAYRKLQSRAGGAASHASTEDGLDPNELPELDGDYGSIIEFAATIAIAVAAGRVDTARANAASRALRQMRSAIAEDDREKLEALEEEMEKIRSEVEQPWKS